MENDLYLKPKKCEFCKEKIEWLGMVIEEGKITMDPGKLKGIQDWPAPATVKQVRGFLGFGNFYRCFIQGFSEITRPLNELLKKVRKFEWTAECQQAFEELKTRFTSEPVLMLPDQTKPFQIKCDTSKYASGVVLTQLDSNRDQHPCAFISKTFSQPREIMRSTTENYWPSFGPWRNGDTIFKDHPTRQLFSQTTKI